MDKKYVTLFQELAQATAVTSETVMDYDRQKGDDKGLETATSMRNDFQELTDRIKAAGDEYIPTKNDAAKLLVAAMIQANQIQTRIENLQKAMAGYQTDVVPKLQEIVDNAKDDDDARKIANEEFIIKDNK